MLWTMGFENLLQNMIETNLSKLKIILINLKNDKNIEIDPRQYSST
jgi:hypothetical protein